VEATQTSRLHGDPAGPVMGLRSTHPAHHDPAGAARGRDAAGPM